METGTRYTERGREHSRPALKVIKGMEDDLEGEFELASETLETALAQAFGEARNFRCGLLFEFPPQMLGAQSGRAAACLCEQGGKARLFFLNFFDAGAGEATSLSLFEENEVPQGLCELGWSYARVLSHLTFMVSPDRFSPGTAQGEQRLQ